MNGFIAILVLAGLVSCGGAPYVHIEGHYDRESDTFKNGIADRSEVTVCYAKQATSPQKVTQLAIAECGRFGKRARFTMQTLSVCPLTTPMAAVFACLADGTAETIRK